YEAARRGVCVDADRRVVGVLLRNLLIVDVPADTGVRQRQRSDGRERQRIDPVARDCVVRELRTARRSGRGIEDASAPRLREVALPLQFGRDRDGGQVGGAFAPAQLLVRGGKGRAPRRDRSTERSAEVVALKLRQIAREIERLRV